MTTTRKIFDAMRVGKENAGLHPEQAALVALRQLIRDAQGGQLDMAEVVPIIMSEEVRCGSTKEAAELLIKDILEGKPCGFAKRDVGAQPRQRRLRRATPNPRWEAECEARSAELSAWANGALNMHGGSR